MGEASLNESIALLYDRVDKYKSADYYRELKPQPWIDWEHIDRAKGAWYRSMFEGDGTGSWYGFLVPDTKSVVSRNSVSDDSAIKKVLDNKRDFDPQGERQRAAERDFRDAQNRMNGY